jgi:hypothetical protein
MRTVRLGAGGRVGVEARLVVELELVAIAGAQPGHDAVKIAVRLTVEDRLPLTAPPVRDRDPAACRGPDPNVGSPLDQLRAHRVPTHAAENNHPLADVEVCASARA